MDKTPVNSPFDDLSTQFANRMAFKLPCERI